MELRSCSIAPETWIRATLAEVCDIFTSGGTPSRSKPSFYKNGLIPWVKTKELNDKFIYYTEETITEEALRASSAKLLPRDTILMAMYGATVGQLGILSDEMACNQACAAMHVNQEVSDRDFVFYQLLLNRNQIVSSAGGAAQQNLSGAQIRQFIMPFPYLPQQRKIGSLLRTFDNKIELNQRLNETLEASARALFRDWFVDFGPTRAKAEGRPAYLAPDLWSLFPDRLDDGGVPEGWTVGTLADVCDLNPETCSARSHPTTVRYVDLSNTKWGYIETVEPYGWDDAPSRARRVLRCGDTIVGTVRPGNGSFAFVGEDGLTGSTGFAVLRPRAASERAFVWCAATDPENIDRLAHIADGGAYPAVRPEVVLTTEALIAPAILREAFGKVASAYLDRIEINKSESRTLAANRDMLLPKLMSGEIHVRDAEALAA